MRYPATHQQIDAASAADITTAIIQNERVDNFLIALLRIKWINT